MDIDKVDRGMREFEVLLREQFLVGIEIGSLRVAEIEGRAVLYYAEVDRDEQEPSEQEVVITMKGQLL